MSTRYYVWSPRGAVYHDGAYATHLSYVSLDCRGTRWQLTANWLRGKRPPRGRRLCKRCEKLRAKGAKG